ncbi:ACT domain-containing protein [Moorella sulfitireducens (nom. illeg.)]|uniref:ACT domain-containing protein n=1 Tax=Neomoorella sulfitireducens TaxID=2972948 RepID=UPI0021ABAFDC|nr:ACT domain-containing protein [Moorella sulfitireducens]
MTVADGRAIITVLGQDRVGILAGITAVLAVANVNILDISQTILQEFFTMIMIVDLKGSNLDFFDLQKQLKTRGEELGVQVTMQQAEVFKFMHRI